MKTRLMSSDLPGFFQGTEMPDATWWQALFPNPAQILTLVGLAPGMDAVDLCSGDGRLDMLRRDLPSRPCNTRRRSDDQTISLHLR